MLVVGLHALVYGRYLPFEGRHMGHDYGYYLPNLLAGAYWFHHNGPWSIPWFTPAFCGGVPYYAHPSCGYVSFPQAAAIVAGPIVAVKATLSAFAALGFLGTYLLLRRTFALSLAVALCGATIFAWNGFFTARMMSGHLFFHAQMLVPLSAWWITRPVLAERRIVCIVLDALFAGIAFAYAFQAGNFYGLVPAGLSCAAIALFAAVCGGNLRHGAVRLVLACVFALLLCSAKLGAGIAFLQSFPRSGYPLPGASNPLAALVVVIQSSFVFPSVDLGRYAFVNERWRLDVHEWDFQVTWVAGALIAAGVWRQRARWRGLWTVPRTRVLVIALAGVLCVPIAFNTYAPGWSALLKHIPVVQNSSSLVRWFAAYVPVFAVLAALALERLSSDARQRTRLAVAAAALVMLTHALRDRSFYAQQPYDPTRIVTAFDDLARSGRVPPIERCSLRLDQDGRPNRRPGVNDGLAEGASPIAAFEPIFGYDLEWFPLGTLHHGAARELIAGRYNVKSPAGYVFPAENGLTPGEHFRVGRTDALSAFLDYRPFPFARSRCQRGLEIVNMAALAGVLALLVAVACAGLVARIRRGVAHPGT